MGLILYFRAQGFQQWAHPAFGGGVETASKDGANYGQAVKYGALSAAVEVATEKMFGGFTKNVYGKGVLDKAMSKVAKSAIGKFALSFGEEALEEFAATAVEPIIREVYQKGSSGELLTPEHWEQALTDGLIGGLTSMAYGGTLGQIGKTTRNISESLVDIKNVETAKQKAWEKGDLSETQEMKMDSDKEVFTNELNQKLAKLNDKKRQDIVKKFGLELDENNKIKTYEAEDGYNKSAYSATLHGKESQLKYKPVKLELNSAQKEAVKFHNDINKLSKVKTNIVVSEDLGTTPDGQKIDAAFDKGTMYISSSVNNSTLLKRKIVHEMTHSTESLSDKSAYAKYMNAIGKALEESAEVKAMLDPNGDQWKKVVELYASQLEGKTYREQRWIVTTELMAQYSEKIFTDEKVIKRLTQENRTIAQKIYNKIKNLITYWNSRKNKSLQERVFSLFTQSRKNFTNKPSNNHKVASTLQTVRAIGELEEEIESRQTRMMTE